MGEWQKLTSYLPANDGLKSALTGADIVVIPAGVPRTSNLLSILCENIFSPLTDEYRARQAGHDP